MSGKPSRVKVVAPKEVTRPKKKTELYFTGELFRKASALTAHGVGHPWSFVGALFIVVLWSVTGPLFHFSDTWQLVINTGTTIVTFLMVFLIQNTQNRDSHAIHLKLDELIHANRRARNRLMALEELSEAELDELQEEFDRLARAKSTEVRESRSRTTHSTTSNPSGSDSLPEG